jgi:hypothetical protein
MECPLCHEEDVFSVPEGAGGYGFRCKICGDYHIGFRTYAIIGREGAAVQADIASWVYHQNRMGIAPAITTETVEQIKIQHRPDVKTRAELYLSALVRMVGGVLKGQFTPDDQRLRVASWSRDPRDCYALAEYLQGWGAIVHDENTAWWLTVSGH